MVPFPIISKQTYIFYIKYQLLFSSGLLNALYKLLCLKKALQMAHLPETHA